MPVKGFRLAACALIIMAAAGSSAFAAPGRPDPQACAGVDRTLSPARRQDYAGLIATAIGKGVTPPQVQIHSALSYGAWSAAYAGTPVADDGFFFFRKSGSRKRFRDVWGGMAQPSDRPALIAWARKIGAPARFAACFAQTAIGG